MGQPLTFRPFFEEQRRRRRQTWFFVGLGVLWVAMLGFFIFAAHLAFWASLDPSHAMPARQTIRQCLLAAGIAVALWGLVASAFLWSAPRLLPRLVGAHAASDAEARQLASLAQGIENMAIASGCPAPEASGLRWYVLESEARNAFAVGRSESSGAVIATRGLLRSLAPDELEGVVAHELAHLRNGDAYFVVQALAFAWMVLGAGVLGITVAVILAIIFGTLTYVLFKIAGSSGNVWVSFGAGLAALGVLVYGIAVLFAYIVLVGVVLLLVVIGVKAASSAVAQSREYLADACAAQWTRRPWSLASALEKVAGGAHLGGVRGAAVAPLWLERAACEAEESSWQRLLAFLLRTHPSVERRVGLLRDMSGSAGVTDARWLAAVRPGGWERFREWALPALATVLAAALTIAVAVAIAEEHVPWVESRHVPGRAADSLPRRRWPEGSESPQPDEELLRHYERLGLTPEEIERLEGPERAGPKAPAPTPPPRHR